MNRQIDLNRLHSAMLIPGDAQTAYRDPAVIFEAGVFHLYCTMVENLPGETQPYLRLAEFTSGDLLHWDGPVRSPRATGAATGPAPEASYGTDLNGFCACKPIAAPTAKNTAIRIPVYFLCVLSIWSTGLSPS